MINTYTARTALYALRRRFGAPGDLYHINSIVDNPETGAVITNRTKYVFKHIIILPQQLNRANDATRTAMPSIEIDQDDTHIIIDKRNPILPEGFKLAVNDYIIVHTTVRRKRSTGRRYNIKKIIDLEDGVSWLLTAKYVKDAELNEIFDIPIRENLVITQMGAPSILDVMDGSNVLPIEMPIELTW